MNFVNDTIKTIKTTQKKVNKCKRDFNKLKKNITVVITAFATLFMVDLSTKPPSSTTIQTQSNVFSWCELVRVVDGDTLIVKYNGEDTRVRLIGIDTPESVHVDSSKNTQSGVVASDYVKNLLKETKKVALEFDEDMYDIYDRLLAYVYLEDGTMLNAHLLIEGYAEIKTFKPNTKYLSYFESLVN